MFRITNKAKIIKILNFLLVKMVTQPNFDFGSARIVARILSAAILEVRNENLYLLKAKQLDFNSYKPEITSQFEQNNIFGLTIFEIK